MKIELQPQSTDRAEAFDLWMDSPMPMVTLTKTLDITRLCRVGRQKSLKPNMLMCWCIGKAASQVREFRTLPENGRLYQYDSLAVNVIVNNSQGGINSCDIPYSEDIQQFAANYRQLAHSAATACRSTFLDDRMVIGTSAMVGTELDSIVNQYSAKFCNPMVMWGKYRTKWFRTHLPVSFQFHHVQMDGGHAARFLNLLQTTIDSLPRQTKQTDK